MTIDVKHNHLTRDIKYPGLCPACDEHHRLAAEKPLPTVQKALDERDRYRLALEEIAEASTAHPTPAERHLPVPWWQQLALDALLDGLGL